MLFKEKEKKEKEENENNKCIADKGMFDLFKVNKSAQLKKEKTEQKKLFWLNFIWGFIALQGIFVGTNVFQLENDIKTQQSQMFDTYQTYKDLKESVHNGNELDIINNFLKIKHNNHPINDLLTGNFLLLASIPDEKDKNTEEYKLSGLKITPQTQEILLNIYKKEWNSGIIKEKNKLNNWNCFVLDLPCYIAHYISDSDRKIQLNSINYKIEATHYNITHIDEYRKWNKLLIEKIENKIYKEENFKSPGNIFADKNMLQIK